MCSRGIYPTRDDIAEVVVQLSKRWGQVAHRMDAGQRTWRQVDVFGLASTQTRCFQYAGSEVLWRQLCDFDSLRSLAVAIGAMQGQVKYFHEIVDVIGRAGVAGYGAGGYWTCHLARIFVPDFCGVGLLKTVRYSPRCAMLLNKMGMGALQCKELGIPSEAPLPGMLKLCAAIEALGRRYGYVFRMAPPHLVCAVCEAHRRGVFTGYARRRLGL